MKIMASGPITSWQIDGKQWKQWETFFSWALKSLQMVTAAMKLKDIPWKKSYDKSIQCIKKQRHHFADKGLSSQSYDFSSSHVWMTTSLVAQMVKRLPAMWETQVRSLGGEDLLEKEMATHSSTLAWKIPWMEEPGGLQSMGSQRVGHDWATSRWASLVAQMVKRLPAMRETQVRSMVWEDPLEKEMATHSSTLAWKIPWTEEPGRLQPMESQRVGHDWATSLSFTMIT